MKGMPPVSTARVSEPVRLRRTPVCEW